MKSDFNAEVLADSISPDGIRLITFEVTFPRFILAEFNTHRMLSRNSASSRAIPTEKLIERVRENPFIPLTFNKRVKGMGVGEALDEVKQAQARAWWRGSAMEACERAQGLMEYGIDKSRANRLLEPFMWHTAIVSATEWDNFFALRDNEAAQPEFQITAHKMREAMEASVPEELSYGEWHLPLVEPWEVVRLGWERSKYISASRCARVSFDRHRDREDLEVTFQRAIRLKDSGHLSPFEHVARPQEARDLGPMEAMPEEPWFIGNFRGWLQMRKEIPHEENFGALSAQAL